ncbi:MAG TPA: hypothetical protein VHA77_08050, partial [Xanthobacteraceae bacterium]|nr:hypothetical protein [Xanthobacteraceae bacterium]
MFLLLAFLDSTRKSLGKDRLAALIRFDSQSVIYNYFTTRRGMGMIAALGRIAGAIAIGFIPIAAAAQVIPPSEQPGRERERFVVPQAPLAQPGGAAIALPSTTAPAGAEKVSVVVRDV